MLLFLFNTSIYQLSANTNYYSVYGRNITSKISQGIILEGIISQYNNIAVNLYNIISKII